MGTDDQDSPNENKLDDLRPTANKPNFMGIPLTGWAIFAVSLIVVLYAAGHFGFKLYDDWKQAKQIAAANAAANEDTSTYTNAVTREMVAHNADGSGHHFTLHTDSKGETVATYFDSDGCIALSRPGVALPYLPTASATLEWSLGPDKRPPSHAPISATPLGATNTSLSSGTESRPRLLRVQAGCWNNGPHPWPFHTWWGPANGCWAPFYRQWNDGCTHYQMFNACNGQWDPRIIWTFCNPQHHP